MKSHEIGLFIIILTGILILAGVFATFPQSKNTLEGKNLEIIDDGGLLPPDVKISRGTRSSMEWPTHRYDTAHTGYTTSPVPNNNTILWSNTTGNGDGYGSPVIADGRVFVGSRDGYLYCFDLYTGQRIWRTYLSSSDFGVCSTPAVANAHVVVFCSGNDTVYRLRISDGGINWSYPTGGGAYGGSSPAISNGRVYIGSGNRNLYCLNETTGNLIWRFTTGAAPVRPYGIQSSPAVANGRVFVGACDCYLYCFNETQPTAPNAQYYWRTNLFDAIFGSPAVAYGRVYCGSGYYNYGEGTNSHTMFCLDELTGAVIWSYVTGSDILSSPAIADGKCYFTSTDGHLYCVDALSGGPTPALYWSNTTGESWSSPAVSDGKVVVGSIGTNRLYCFNATSGELVWDYLAGNDVYSSTAIADRKVVVIVRGSPESVICFGNLTSPPSPPAPPINIQAELVGGGFDIMLTWDASPDDGIGDDDVVGYTVYKSKEGFFGNYEIAAWITADDSPRYDWMDVGSGDGDLNDYFYIVRANDSENNEEQNLNKVGKVVNHLIKGWNLISVPLIQYNTSKDHALQTLVGNYSAAQAYHSGNSEPWLHWNDNKPAQINDFIDVSHNNGYYILMDNDDYLVTAGRVPATTSIYLYSGWNMVGFPSLENRTVIDALSSISGLYSKVMFQDTSSGKLEGLGPSDVMRYRYGYWVYVTADCELIM